MRLLNKLYSYDESIFPKLILILKVIDKKPCRVTDLYKKVKSTIISIEEYMEALDCLYALGLIEYEEGEIKICSTK